MKIRTNYVSNSSSSSFIIAYSDESCLKAVGSDGKEVPVLTIDDFFDIIERDTNNWSGDQTSIRAKGLDNTLSYITEKDDWGYSHYSDETVAELKKKLKESEFKEAAVLQISYHDELISRLMKRLKQMGQIEMIDGDENDL